MPQLSAHDATFLYSDTTHSNANVSLVHIYNQSTAPGGRVRFKTILKHIESRLDRLPILRRKLRRVPLDLDYPYWVDDGQFDLEYHVRHIALPKPGDWRQFCIQASRIHARPLDLNRPLWEIYVIEGLDGFLDLPVGSFALLTKMHHAAIDVENGNEVTMLLHDLDATPPANPPPAPWFAERPPGGVRMVRACDEAGVRLFVVKQNRRNRTLQLLRQAIQGDRFGRIYMVNVNVFWTRPQSYYDSAEWRGTWEFDGGAFMNQASHYVDLLDWLIGPVESVMAYTGTLARRIEVEDTGVAALRWRNGAMGSVKVTMLTM